MARFLLCAVATFSLLASCGTAEHPPAEATGSSIDAGVDTGADPGPLVNLPLGGATVDPATCDAARDAHSYVGCDYWPTVMANVVWSYFDYTIVVSNVSNVTASLTVTGPNATNQQVTVDPGKLVKIVLPWVDALKGASNVTALSASTLAAASAYHLVSSVPVVAYQFSALEYKRTYTGPDTDESKGVCDPNTHQCYSFTNDASILMPSTAWTQSYRVSGLEGEATTSFAPANGGYVVAVASADNTTVSVQLSAAGGVLPGTGITAVSGGQTLTQVLNAGDVLQLATPPGETHDLSGSLVSADKPIEVFTGNPCKTVPSGTPACDHIEESVLPAESLGKDYIVTTPTRPSGGLGKHVVRFFGNRDGTVLSYAPRKPSPSCPDTLNAGDVADCGMVSVDFIVQGTQEFAVSSFTASAQNYSTTDPRGDPDQSNFMSTLQFRTRYVFLAPEDYDVNYAVITGESTAAPVIDGQPATHYTELSSGYGVWRETLSQSGAHTMTSDRPVGLQVMGYGAYTSYTYPGGLTLTKISPPPILK